MTPEEFIEKWVKDMELKKRMLNENAIFFTKEEKKTARDQYLAINAVLCDVERLTGIKIF